MELRSENERWSIPAPDMEASPLTAGGYAGTGSRFFKGQDCKIHSGCGICQYRRRISETAAFASFYGWGR